MNAPVQRAATVGYGLLATALAYLVVTAGHVPLLVYLPIAGRWTFAPPPDALTMDWFYRALVALIAGALGAALGARVSRSASERHARTVLGLAFAALLWAVLFTAFTVVATRVGNPGG